MRTKPQNPSQQRANKSDQQPVAEVTFLEHVYELRSRLFWIVATVLIGSAAGFQFKDQLIAAVMAPLHGEKLVYLTPGGGFGFIFTVSIYFGLLVAIPVIIFHIYRFLQPLLAGATRRLMIIFMMLSIVLAVAGTAFGYFVTVPAALEFLSTFAGDAVTPNLTADSYLNFVVAYVLGLALLFQLPLLLFLFDHVRPFPPGSLLSSQRYIIIGSTIVAAIITPTPDAFNMALVAVPIIVVYQFGVFAVLVRRMSRRRNEKRATEQISSNDEPLAAILNELEAGQVHTPQPKQVITPAAHIRKQQLLQQRQAIDGLTRPRTVSDIRVPTRQQTVERSPLRPSSAPPTRTVDGFTIVRAS